MRQNFVCILISFTGAFRAILGSIRYVPGTRAVLNGRGVKLSSQLRLVQKLKCIELYLYFPVCSYDVVLIKDGFTFTPARYILFRSLVVMAAARTLLAHVAFGCVLVIHSRFRTDRINHEHSTSFHAVAICRLRGAAVASANVRPRCILYVVTNEPTHLPANFTPPVQ